MKRLEKEITDLALQHLRQDSSATVVINSTWYTQELHQQTLEWLGHNHWTNIVLVAMIDPAIPMESWFQQFDRPVLGLGSYRGPGDLTFWAHALDRHFKSYDESMLTDTSSMDMAYMCLNRKPHWHRLRLYQQLESMKLLDRGLVSLGSDGHGAVRPLPREIESYDLSPNSGSQHYGMPNDNASLGHIDNWRRHFINIVTETAYDIRKTWFVSEKIFKPILGLRPFLVYDTDGATEWLQQRGFQPYVEDFKDITDVDLSCPGHIALFLEILDRAGPGYWRQKYLDLLPKMQYNKHRFYKLLRDERDFLQQGLPCQI